MLQFSLPFKSFFPKKFHYLSPIGKLSLQTCFSLPSLLASSSFILDCSNCKSGLAAVLLRMSNSLTHFWTVRYFTYYATQTEPCRHWELWDAWGDRSRWVATLPEEVTRLPISSLSHMVIYLPRSNLFGFRTSWQSCRCEQVARELPTYAGISHWLSIFISLKCSHEYM